MESDGAMDLVARAIHGHTERKARLQHLHVQMHALEISQLACGRRRGPCLRPSAHAPALALGSCAGRSASEHASGEDDSAVESAAEGSCVSFLTSIRGGLEKGGGGGSKEGVHRGGAGVHAPRGAPPFKTHGSLSSQARQRGGNKDTRPDAVVVAESTSAIAAHGDAMSPSEQESGTFACLSDPDSPY